MLEANIPVALVVADRSCRGIAVAESADIPCVLQERTEFGPRFDRDSYSLELSSALEARGVDLLAMAGFGTILGAPMFEAFAGRIINTHPALLPAFPGWHAVRDALAYGVKVTGCTIHVATPVVDDGPIIAQEAVAVLPDDDESSLHERIKAVERRLYVETLREILARGTVLDTPDPTPTGVTQ